MSLCAISGSGVALLINFHVFGWWYCWREVHSSFCPSAAWQTKQADAIRQIHPVLHHVGTCIRKTASQSGWASSRLHHLQRHVITPPVSLHCADGAFLDVHKEREQEFKNIQWSVVRDRDSSVGRASDLRVWFQAGNVKRIFFSELTFCADSCLVSVPPPMLPQWHIKDPSHSAKSAGSRLQLNTCTTLTQWSQGGLAMLSRHSVRTYREMCSHATGQGMLVHSHLSSLWHCGLIPGLMSGVGACKLISA